MRTPILQNHRLAQDYVDGYSISFARLLDRRQAIIFLDYLQDVILPRLETNETVRGS